MTQNFDTTDIFAKKSEIEGEGGVINVTNKASGGSVGTAALTVDIAGVLRVNQTTASQTLTLPDPTEDTIDHRLTVINVGSASFIMGGVTIAANGSAEFMWNSTYSVPAWAPLGSTPTSQSVEGNISSTGSILSSSGTGGVGYSTGAGAAGVQASSRTTTVVINGATGAMSGSITLVSAAGSATPASFTVTNAAVAATDVIIVNQKSGTDKYEIFVTAVAAGSFQITSYTTGGTTTEQPVFNFAVIRGVAA